jgi:hypothetical protein
MTMQQTIQTATLARATDRKPASIRTAVWRNGHFCGIKPIKLPNGRLLWPADAAARLIAGEVA